MIEEERYIPYALAKKYIDELIKNGQSSAILQRTFDYLNLISKCNEEGTEKIMDELKEIIQREDIRVVISSICPMSTDEVRAILSTDSKTYSQDDIDKVLDIVRKYTSQS
ncbi:RNA polymerase Rpb4 family protein [Acidianus sp. RZ1]